MHKITFLLEPVAASRPRVTRYGTFYSPIYEQFRKDVKTLLMGERKVKIYTEPLELDVVFHMSIPTSYAKIRRKELHGKFCTRRPDLDNLEKALYDAMNGTIYQDDSQIVCHHVKKIWTNEKVGKIEVSIKTLKDGE